MVNCVQISKLTVGVVDTVSVILLSDLREMLDFGAILLNVLQARISEESRSHWGLRSATELHIFDDEFLEGVRSVIEERLERASEHFVEAKSQNAVGMASCDGLVGHVESSGSRRAIVVHVDNGNSSVSHSVDGSLATRGVSVDIADEGLLNLIKFETSVSESTLHCNMTQIMIVIIVFAWFHKVSHAVANDVHFWALSFLHI